MEVYISINGVLRNLIKKFDYHYQNNFIEAQIVVDEGVLPFDYKITEPIQNDDLTKYYSFQSKEEFNNFCFVDFPLELFGNSTLSYPNVISDLNKIIYENPDISFTVIGIDEFLKAKSSTLYFLSKHSYLGNNIKFIKSDNLDKEWEKCDIWVTDDKFVIDKCPSNKKSVKFTTEYNNYFTHATEINDFKKLELTC